MNSPDHELSGYFGWGFGTSTPFWLRQRIAFPFRYVFRNAHADGSSVFSEDADRPMPETDTIL